MALDNHWAIFLTNNSDKKSLLKSLLEGKIIEEVVSKKVVIFSEIVLKDFIEQEDRFGKIDLNLNENRSIATLSGGEQKKALLNYCISQNPDYLVLDNPFDNLDIDSQAKLSIQLDEISTKIKIIQLVNRRDDLLQFIEKYIVVDDKNKIEIFENTNGFNRLKKESQNDIFLEKIPEPIQKHSTDEKQLVSFKDVTVKYAGKTIFADLTWQVNQSEYWQLLGPNGAGKTTLLSMIIGDNPKAFGQDITLFGFKKGSGESVWDLKKSIGYFTPSIINLFVRNTSLEHMIVSGIFDSIGLYKLPSERQMRLANEWLKLLNFQHLAKTPFYKLTAGQQRLAMIARAMVKHPPLLILDEPTAGLDDRNALIVSCLINKIANETDSAIIYVSHRKEPGLEPQFIYELVSTTEGSIGKMRN
ncbi:MAG: ATP-binding cassette domain-containing protein [Bacteroidota bacterium]